MICGFLNWAQPGSNIIPRMRRNGHSCARAWIIRLEAKSKGEVEESTRKGTKVYYRTWQEGKCSFELFCSLASAISGLISSSWKAYPGLFGQVA